MKHYLFTIVAAAAMAVSTSAVADPENTGRVKVQMPTLQATPAQASTDSVADDLQGVVVLCADGSNSCQPKTQSTESTADDLQGVVVLCADGSNSCQPKAQSKEGGKKAQQHNQSDMEFTKERAK